MNIPQYLVNFMEKNNWSVHADDDEALQMANYYGHSKIVAMLINAGADVHANNDQALRWASFNGHTEIVTALINAGADTI